MKKSPPQSLDTSKRCSIGAQRNPSSQEAILKAAEIILKEEGYNGFTIDKVAARAKAGKPTIYRWWSSKAALLLDVYLRQKRIEWPDTGNIEEDISLFINGIFQAWRDTVTGDIFRSFIAESQSNEETNKVLSHYAAGRRKILSEMVARAQQRGEVSLDIDPEVTADWVASWLWVHLLTGRLDEPLEKTRIAIRQITQGILSK